MEQARKPSVRGLITLGLLGALAVGLLVSPVGAAKGGLTLNKLRRNVNIIHGTEAGPAPVADTLTKIAQLDLLKGNYGIVAKVHIVTDGLAPVECVLALGTTTLDHGATAGAFQDVIALNTAITLGGSGGTVELRCADGAATSTWQHVSITAFKLPKLTAIDLTP